VVEEKQDKLESRSCPIGGFFNHPPSTQNPPSWDPYHPLPAGEEKMSQNIYDAIDANALYAAKFVHKGLPIPPSRRLIILTCMDARIDPAASLGLKEGEAHVIRNAGGRPQDAMRSIILSQHLLGTRDIQVYHHTSCGMLTFTEEVGKNIISADISNEGKYELQNTALLPITQGLKETVKADVEFLQSSKATNTGAGLLHPDSNITGWIFRVEDGRIEQVC